ncbi:quinolinate synthase NadA [Sinomicrobium soli]|uniref:quinolinate synthase NadA n=1 Tax=Sinomicrobium sp. N-1-3-6 TaxID=2219864 RepID=UPI000DCDBE12|nr:quinolinate synthase NadA [Sinomicrobium sp. N-1-3-6]RAV30029.1 quinolinate synthase [Sinomicrobium sp. N-1-3-6]
MYDHTFYQEEIKKLLKDKNAILLAHYYQDPSIQDLADVVGDSLELARHAAKTDAPVIVFAGVYFMAETAKILNPGKKVLLPDLSAGCSLADHCTPEAFTVFRQRYPDHRVVSYINTSAAIKALSDYVCTSSNAERVIRSVPEDQPLIFAPDKNLGKYLIEKTGRDMVLWEGSCVVHEAFSMEKLIALVRKYPGARIVAHPESEMCILRAAHYTGSTSQMRRYVRKSKASAFIIGTEAGVIHQMKRECPEKEFIPLPSREDNSCACSECAYMKVNTLEKLYRCLRNEAPEVHIGETLRKNALRPIRKMFELS